MPQVERKPNWNVWAHVPVRAYEAVALSLDVDPKRLKVIDHSWMAGPGGNYPHAEGKEFDDRLEVLRRNVSEFDLVTVTMGEPDRCQLRLPEFAHWALSLGWT